MDFSTMLPQLLQNPGSLLILVFVMVLGVGQLTIQRETTSAKKDDLFVTFAADVRRDLEILREDYTKLMQKHGALDQQFRTLVVERDNLRTELDDRNKRIIELEAQLDAAKARIATLESEVKDLQSKVEAKT